MTDVAHSLYFRHDHIRPSQKELMGDIYDAISARKNFMAQAPTGLGKTDAVLSASLTYALENDLTVFFLTPKISQHKIAMEVVDGLAKKHDIKVRAVDLVGRAHCCIDENLRELDNESFQTTCERKRQRGQCPFYNNARGRGMTGEAKSELRFKKMLEEYGAGKTHGELHKLGMKGQCCPYEWSLKLASLSNVVVADYYHILVPRIRETFLAKTKKNLEKAIVVVDEAHNLASRVRSSLSRGVNNFILDRVTKEMRTVNGAIGSSDPLGERFSKWAAGMLGPIKERTLRFADFLAFMENSDLGLSLDEMVVTLENTGSFIVEKTGKKSACLRLSRFLAAWADDPEDDYSVRIIRTFGGNFYLSKRLLDPSPATCVLNECASSILMSGTLLPLEMHRDVLGLDRNRTTMKAYPSPFDRSSIVNIIAENLTTRYSKRDLDGYTAIASKIDSVVSSTPGGTAVFFPSYEVMNNVLPLLLSRNLHLQKPGMRPSEVRDLLKNFKDGGVLCGVQGGSLSEGVDYCEGEIKTVVIVGIALEEMNVESRALIDYYDAKFGRGWDYGYLYPGTIKALQAAGRARRKEEDRVAVVYMDERFKWAKYNWILSKDELMLVTDKPEDKVREFWNEKAVD